MSAAANLEQFSIQWVKMTKTRPLSSWRTYNKRDYLNGEWSIDWPSIHRELGVDCIQWLMDQEHLGRLQMMIEKKDRRMRLVVEFYSSKTEREFATLWQIYPKII